MNKILIFMIFIIQSITAAAISPELQYILSRNKYLLQGEKLSAADLEGKVIFIGSAHSTWPSCKGTLPHLQVVQEKFKNTKELLVISAVRHKSGDKKRLLAFVESMKVDKLQVYMRFQPGDLGVKAEKQWGLHGPWYVVIDSNGKIALHTQSGSAAVKALPALIKKAPYKNDLFPEIFIKHNKKMAEKLILGKPVRTTLMSLSNLSKRQGDAADEAKTILEAFNNWGKEEQSNIHSMKDTSLLKSYIKMDSYCKTFAGMEQFNLFAGELSALKKNKLLMSSVNYYKQIQRCYELDNGTTKNRKIKSLISSLDNFIRTQKPTDLLKSDLEKMKQDLESL